MKRTNNKLFDTPVLFIIYRREDAALRVIKAIARVKPKKLYISQDGPRNEKERIEIENTRKAVLSKVNWKCELTVWTHNRNLGLKKHAPTAFDDFFKKEEYGIYLEDDTVPSREFFYFEEEMLKRYKNNRKVFSVNGTNFYTKLIRSKDSYYLSKIGDIWGFGLWRRSWKLYDSNLKDYHSFSRKLKYKSYFFNQKYRFYLESFWQAIINKKLDSWAMPLVYTAVRNDMYFITPKFNMVNNIGSNNAASNVSLQTYYEPFGNPFPLKHPDKLEYDKTNDLIYLDNMLKGGWLRLILIRLYLISPHKLRIMMKNFANKFLNK